MTNPHNPFNPSPPPPPSEPPWLKPLLFIGGAFLLGLGVAAFTSDDEDDERGTDATDEPEAELTRAERFHINREQGAHFEGLTREIVGEIAPGARVEEQVCVTTPDGRNRRIDFAIHNANGSVTAVEAKCVAVLLEEHVTQAEDHRVGLRHKFGVRSGPTIVVVREDTVVSEEFERRVRIVRI